MVLNVSRRLSVSSAVSAVGGRRKSVTSLNFSVTPSLRKLSTSQLALPQLDVIVVGSARSGKQSLIDVYNVEEFAHLLQRTNVHNGQKIKIPQIKLEGKNYRWNVIKERDIDDIVYRGSLPSSLSAIIFVFKVNDAKSFIEITKTIAASYDILRSFHIPMLLVGTCCDHDSATSSRKINDLCDKFSLQYIPTSAKRQENVKHVFDTILSLVIFKKLHYDRFTTIRDSTKDKFITLIMKDDVSSLKRLLINSKTPCDQIKDGWSLIHFSAWQGSIDTAKLFIQMEPVCVNCGDRNGLTPLHIASRMGHLKFITFLIDNGADVFIKDLKQNDASVSSFESARKIIIETQALYISNQKLFVNNIPSEPISKNISFLNLSYSNLSVIPDAILSCSELQQLILSNNSISNINLDFTKLRKLRTLCLSSNEILTLPGSITSLERLELLDLRSNKISGISPEIGTMKYLRSLLLGHNFIRSLPNDIVELEETLQILELYGNPLNTIPEHAKPKLGQNRVDDLARLFLYLQSISTNGQEEYNRVKIMFLGDGNVGKT